MKKRIKRGLTILLVLFILSSSIPFMAFTALADAPEVLVGDGTAQSPYILSNKQHLNAVRNHLNAYFRLDTDIVFVPGDFELGGDFYNGGKCWLPIGPTSSAAFTGVFNGNGHSIEGLVTDSIIFDTDNGVSGLFGYNAGHISDLGILGGTIKVTCVGNSYAGAIAGVNTYNGTITNCYSTATVQALSTATDKTAYAGGITGRNQGVVTSCYNSGEIDALTEYSCYTGGIAGENSRTLSKCYNTGDVTAMTSRQYYTYAAGIAGINNSTISDCYNAGSIYSVSGYNAYAGGIVGRASTNSSVNTCYNIGSISVYSSYNSNSSYAFAGGIAGSVGSPDRFTRCFFLDIVPQGFGYGNDTENVVSLTLTQMNSQNSFVGFNFVSVWNMNQLGGYPFPELREAKHVSRTENTVDFAGGSGECYNPYRIETKEQLSNVRHYPRAAFLMTSDIVFEPGDFAATGDYYNGGSGWEPIGATDVSLTKTPFIGVFDGGGHTISGLVVTITGSSRVGGGLFGWNQGIIRDLKMTDGNINASGSTQSYSYAHAGGIAAYNIDGTIINCRYTGMVYASTSSSVPSYAGGIAGRHSGGIISGCYVSGNVIAGGSSFGQAGGVSAWVNRNGVIADCGNNADVSTTTGYSRAGGIMAESMLGTITRCFNTGDITAKANDSSFAGGIVGTNSANCIVSDCYNVGNMSSHTTGTPYASHSDAGGIAASNSGNIARCYNVGSANAIHSSAAYAGGIAGNNAGLVEDCYYLDNMTQGIAMQKGSAHTVLCTEEQMKQQSTFVNFNFDMVWEFERFYPYPYPQLSAARRIKVSEIILLTPPDNDQTLEGLMPDLTGGTARLKYEDGHTATVDLEPNMLIYDMNKIGEQHVYITYGGTISDSYFTITVIEKSLEFIDVTTPPAKTDYVEGNTFNPAGMVVTAYYNNNSSEIVTGWTTPDSPLQCGQTGITVTYKDKTATTPITVAARSLDRIVVTKNSTTLQAYNVGDVLDSEKLEITAVYDNGTSEVISSGFTLQYDFSTPGEKTVFIHYGGKTTSFILMVYAITERDISMKTYPTKTSYLIGEALNVSGAVITVEYSNGTEEDFVVTTSMCSGYNANKVGTQRITITYRGKTTFFMVTVKEPPVNPTGVTVAPKTLSLTKGEIATIKATVHPPNATDKTVKWTSSDTKVATVDKNGKVTAVNLGTATITAKVGSKTATCTVKVENSKIAVTSVKISNVKTNMILGKNQTLKATISPFNATNKTVTWGSNNKTVATVSSTGTVKATGSGTVKITATAGGKSKTVTITVHSYVTMRIGKSAAIQNGKKTTIDKDGTKPFKIDGKTMLPLRFVGEKMGGKVKYINDKKPITMSYGNKKVEFTLNSKKMTVYTNGKKTSTVTLNVAAQKKNGRTYIPLRAISQALGFDVYYQTGTEYIVVNNPKMTSSIRNERLREAKKLIK